MKVTHPFMYIVCLSSACILFTIGPSYAIRTTD